MQQKGTNKKQVLNVKNAAQYKYPVYDKLVKQRHQYAFNTPKKLTRRE